MNSETIPRWRCSSRLERVLHRPQQRPARLAGGGDLLGSLLLLGVVFSLLPAVATGARPTVDLLEFALACRCG